MQTGFFHRISDQSSSSIKMKKRIGPALSCDNCGLDKKCKSPCMPATGLGKKGILIIGEAPGETEDWKNEQFVGKAGKVLKEYVERLGINVYNDTWLTNAVRCRPTKPSKKGRLSNREPTPFEINCCRQHLFEEINQYKPKIIILLGNVALDSFLAHRWKSEKKMGGINKWRGWTIPDRDINAWICPTFHPSFVSRNRRENKEEQDQDIVEERERSPKPVVETIFRQDLQRALSLLNRPFPQYSDEKKCVEILIDEDKIISALKGILERVHLFAIDFETTGLKPHIKGHRIVCCSIADSVDHAIVFPVDHKKIRFSAEGSVRIKALLKEILECRTIKKIAQNLKYENMWARVLLNATVENWVRCTLNATHILDNRPQIGNLKFQTYAQFGLLDYSSHLEPFLKADKKDANSFNRIDDAPLHELLLYCGMDSIFTFRISEIQEYKIKNDPRLKEAYDLFHPGLLSMSEMQYNGIPTNLEYIDDQIIRVSRRIANLQAAFELDTDVQRWRAKYGDKFNIGSDQQLSTFLVQDLGIKLPPTTKFETTGNYSVNARALELIEDDIPFVKKLRDIERLKDCLSKNLKALKREAPDGILHPFFDLHTTVSYRSSSSAINFQNQPIRNPDIARIVRRAFYPSPGNRILEIDFKSIEVGVSACVHRDPNMIRYVSDKNTDMHRDTAAELFLLPYEEISSEIRQCGKGDFVFPQFYGDWYASCADALWRHIKRFNLKTEITGIPLFDHLYGQGIKTYKDFEAHVRDTQDKFWGERFPVYSQWKKDHYKRYEKCGYFYLLTGFRCSGVMDKKQACNYPIQGPAFHFNLWTINRVREIAHKEKWRTKLMGEIHDDVINNTDPDEFDHVIETYRNVVAHDLRERFPQIIVPLEIGIEATGVDRPWFEKEKIRA